MNAKTLLFPFLIVFFACSSVARPISLPWLEAGFSAGITSNLYLDSSAVEDREAELFLTADQELGKKFHLILDGTLQEYEKTGGLANHQLAASIDYFHGFGDLNSIFTVATGSILRYRGSNETYNQNTFSLITGGRYELSDVILLRSEADALLLEYPDYDLSTSVNYNELGFLAGVNYTHPKPFTIDMESGLRVRTYPDVENEVTTRYVWLSGRLSGPLTQKMGGAASLLVQENFDPSQEALYTLFAGGINPQDLLWDGWSLSLGLNRLVKNWRVGVSLGYQENKFIEIPLISQFTGVSTREDTARTFRCYLTQSKPTENSLLSAKLRFEYEYENRNSNYPYYTYSIHRLIVSFSFQTV